MTDQSLKVDNEDVMINCPEGFDARTFKIISKRCFHGTIKKHQISLAFWMISSWFVSLMMGMGLRLPLELKYLQKGAGIISKFLSIRDN